EPGRPPPGARMEANRFAPFQSIPPPAGIFRIRRAPRSTPPRGGPGRPKRAPSRAAMPLRRRQAHNEARAGDRCLALFVWRSGPVFHPDRAAMGIDDLLGDGEAKPRILAEALMRAIGIEPLEHL